MRKTLQSLAIPVAGDEGLSNVGKKMHHIGLQLVQRAVAKRKAGPINAMMATDVFAPSNYPYCLGIIDAPRPRFKLVIR